MNVLFVNHTAVESGAEVSLLDLIAGMPPGVSVSVACPAGDLETTLRGRGVRVEPMPAIDASLRLHPVHTARGLGQTVRAALAIRRAARRVRPDVVHANSVRAGLAAAIARLGGGPPLVVHVRDCLPAGVATGVIRRVLRRAAASVLANSRHTARSFAPESAGEVDVVYSPVDLARFDPAQVDAARVRSELGVDRQAVLGVVGQITPWKGQATAIEAVALLKDRLPDVTLLIVGSVKFSGAAVRYDNDAYLGSLHALAVSHGIEDDVRFVGERRDVPEVLSAIDVLLVPSSEEPFGRVVIEAMAMETPVVATSVGGPREVIEDGVNGRLVEPGDARAWASAIEHLVASGRRLEMGRAGRATAMAFDRRRHAEDVLAVYRRALGREAGEQS